MSNEKAKAEHQMEAQRKIKLDDQFHIDTTPICWDIIQAFQDPDVQRDFQEWLKSHPKRSSDKPRRVYFDYEF